MSSAQEGGSPGGRVFLQKALDTLKELRVCWAAGSSRGVLEGWRLRLESGQECEVHRFVMRLLGAESPVESEGLDAARLDCAGRECEALLALREPLDALLSAPTVPACDLWMQRLVLESRRTLAPAASLEEDPLAEGSAWIRDVEERIARAAPQRQSNGALDWAREWGQALAFCRDPQARPPYFDADYTARKQQIAGFIRRWSRAWRIAQENLARMRAQGAESGNAGVLAEELQVVEPEVLLGEFLEMWRYCKRRWTMEIEAVELRLLKAFPSARQMIGSRELPPFFLPLERARQARGLMLGDQTAAHLVIASGLQNRGVAGQDSHFQEILTALYGYRLGVEVDGAVASQRRAEFSAQERMMANAITPVWNPHMMFWEPLASDQSQASLIAAVQRDFDAMPLAARQGLFGPYLQLLQEAFIDHPELGFRHPVLDDLEAIRRQLERAAAAPDLLIDGDVRRAIGSLQKQGLGQHFQAGFDRIAEVIAQAVAICNAEELPDHDVVESPLGFYRSHLQRIRLQLRQAAERGVDSDEQRLDWLLNRLETLRQKAREHQVAEPDSLSRVFGLLTSPAAIHEHHRSLLASVRATLKDWSKLRASVQLALFQEQLFLAPETPAEGSSSAEVLAAEAVGMRLSEVGARIWLVLTGVLEFVQEGESHPLLNWTQQRAPDCISAVDPSLGEALRLGSECAQGRLQQLGHRLSNGLGPVEPFQLNPALGRNAALALALLPRWPVVYPLLDARVRSQRAICLAAVKAHSGLMAGLPERWRRDPEFLANAIDGCAGSLNALPELLSHCFEEDLLSEQFVLALLDGLAKSPRDWAQFGALDLVCDALPASIRDNDRVAEAIAQLRPINLFQMSFRLQTRLQNRALEAAWCLINLPDAVRDDPNSLRHAVRYRDDVMAFASTRLARDEQLVLELAQINGESVMSVGDLWRDHAEILLAAARTCPRAVALASPALVGDREWVRRVIEANPQTLSYLPLYSFLPLAGQEPEEQGLLAAAVSRDGLLIREVPESHRTPALIRLALSQNGLALAYLTGEQRARPDLVRLAMEQNPMALLYGSPELRASRELCDLLLQRASHEDDAWLIAENEESRRNPEARLRWDRARGCETPWEHWDELVQSGQDDPDAVEAWEAILSKDGLALAHAPCWVREHPDLAMVAFQQDRKALLAAGARPVIDGDFFDEVSDTLSEDPTDPFNPLFAAWLSWIGGEKEASRWIEAFPNAYPLLPRAVRELDSVYPLAVESAANFALLPSSFRNTKEAIAASWADRIEHQLRLAPLFCEQHRENLLQQLPHPEAVPMVALPYSMRKDREGIRLLAQAMQRRSPALEKVSGAIELLRTMDEDLRSDALFMLEMVDLHKSLVAGAADVLFENEAFITQILCRGVEWGSAIVEPHASALLRQGAFWQRLLRNQEARNRLGDRLEGVFAFAPIEIRRDAAWVRTLALEFPKILVHAAPLLRSDRQFCLDLVGECAACWLGISPGLLTEEFTFQALLRNGHVLQYLSPQERHRDELVAAAYSNDPATLQYAGADLQAGKRFEAIQRRAAALRGSPAFLPEES